MKVRPWIRADPEGPARVWFTVSAAVHHVGCGQRAVLAGALELRPRRTVRSRSAQGDGPFDFAYSETYLERPNAISLYLPELPLERGWQEPSDERSMPGCLRDGSPDSWGQRVIHNRLFGKHEADADDPDIDDLTYLLESGSNRIGALDFQTSKTSYVPRQTTATLDELHRAAQALQDGTITNELAAALAEGTAVGGARPKVIVADDDGREYIAKLSLSTDPYPVVKAEAVSMDLARRVGIPVPPTALVQSLGRDVLLVERFDRPGDKTRRMIVSALTLLGFSDFLGARWSSYPELLDKLHQLAAPGTGGLGRTLLERIIFNVLIGNTDDHARNHAVFWDGQHVELTPAYDLCPQLRTSGEANQAMDIGRAASPNEQGARASNRTTIIAAAPDYGVTSDEAADMFDRQVQIIREQWADAASSAELTSRDAELLSGTQILHRYALT
jgi:serine/threonine-protein kinase HipA